MSAVARAAGGKRAGARPARTPRPKLLGLAGVITVCVVAWGYLVYAAIDFGADARGGDDSAWAFLALAAVGAMACLFIGLMLIARLGRALGLSATPPVPAPPATEGPEPPRAVGGRRAAR